MLKKQQRLRKAEFDRHFKLGRKQHSPLMTLVYSRQADQRFNAAAVVGKKVYKRAVDRNRLRRQLYSLIYRAYQDRGLSGVFIVIAKPAAKDATFANLKTELTNLLSQVAGVGQKS